MIEQLQRTYSNYILKPFLKRYLKKERVFERNGIRIKVPAGVFHPKYFFSTKVLLEFMKDLPLQGKLFCELGCGSGIISLEAFKMGAHVISSDINPTAVEALKSNFQSNFTASSSQSFNVLTSDLFNEFSEEKPDFVLINPPYFFKEANSFDENAWYCGRDGEYFRQLFLQLPGHMNKNSEAYMILGDNCDLDRIKQIASENSALLELKHTQKVKWEKNYIFRINFSS